MAVLCVACRADIDGGDEDAGGETDGFDRWAVWALFLWCCGARLLHLATLARGFQLFSAGGATLVHQRTCLLAACGCRETAAVVLRVLTARATQQVLIQQQELDLFVAQWLNNWCSSNPPMEGSAVGGPFILQKA